LDSALQLKLKADTSEPPTDQAHDGPALWLDYGADDYAGSTWSGGAPGDARQLFIGWMNNWVYATEVPTERWRSAMTVPRELGLFQTERGLEVHSTPVRELDSLRKESLPIAARSGAGPMDLTGLAGATGDLLELDLNLDLRSADSVELRFANASGESTVFRVNKSKGRYELDRSASGAVAFNAAFGNLQVAPIRGNAQALKLKIYMDHSSLEIFLNEGETVFTSLVFPSVPYNLISLKSDQEIELTAGTIYELQSIWK
jgi:sucrose-6-phosphate hydrolase SacC (GH32 family)